MMYCAVNSFTSENSQTEYANVQSFPDLPVSSAKSNLLVKLKVEFGVIARLCLSTSIDGLKKVFTKSRYTMSPRQDW